MVFEAPWLKKPDDKANEPAAALVVAAEDKPSRTAYYVVRAKWTQQATPGSSVVDGYNMASVLEDFLKEKLTELLGLEPEVFVQVDIR